jgi:hypothetical protein
VRSQDHGLTVTGVALAWDDRFEFTLARQDFDTGKTGTALGLPGLRLKQDIVGAKWRVAGDAVLDSDSLMPQIAVGVQFKHLQSSGLDGTLPTAAATVDKASTGIDSGIDSGIIAEQVPLPSPVITAGSSDPKCVN